MLAEISGMARRDAPARGRRPRRADRDPDDPRLPPSRAATTSAPRSSCPTPSHGTNPATATMAGFRTITIPSAADGGVDLEAFRAALGPEDRGDHDHQPVDARAVRARGSASCSRRPTRPARSPTWTARTSTRSSAGSSPARPASTSCTSTPTRRSPRRTAAAARARARSACGAKLVPFLPAPRVLRDGRRLVPPRARGRAPDLDRADALVRRQHRRPRARVRVPAGARRGRAARGRPTTPCSPRTTSRRASATAYRHPVRPAPASTSSSPPRRRLKQRTGVRTLDVAKRLIDKGFHPPTIYFPLTVEEGMLDRADRDRVARDARRASPTR